MTQHEQIQLLGLDKLKVIDKINVMLRGDFQLTGSISLVEYGIVKREISDIDIVVESFSILKIALRVKGYKHSYWFGYSDNTGTPKVTNRISFEIDGVKCCAFYSEHQEFKVCDYILERKFRVSHPRYAIAAKKKYVRDLFQKDKLNKFQISKLKKHSSDIQLYYEKYVEESRTQK